LKRDLLKLAEERLIEGERLGKDPHDGRDFDYEFVCELADAINYSHIHDSLKGTNSEATRQKLIIAYRQWLADIGEGEPNDLESQV
jgi:hypothetical protein